MNIAINENRFYVSWDDYRTLRFDVDVIPFECFRWVNGKIVEAPLEPVPNAAIARRLFSRFQNFIDDEDLPLVPGMKDLQVQTDGQTRIPDVMVISTTLDDVLRAQTVGLITREMEPPLLIVEVVSKSNRDTDLVDKAKEYAELGVPEYWTIDWDRPEPEVIVRTLNSSQTGYISRSYKPGMSFTTDVLPGMTFDVDKVLKGRR